MGPLDRQKYLDRAARVRAEDAIQAHREMTAKLTEPAAWVASVQREGGYGRMTDADCAAWARDQAQRVVRHRNDRTLIESATDAIAVLLEEYRRVDVVLPRDRFGRFDRERPILVEYRRPYRTAWLVLDHRTDRHQPPTLVLSIVPPPQGAH